MQQPSRKYKQTVEVDGTCLPFTTAGAAGCLHQVHLRVLVFILIHSYLEQENVVVVDVRPHRATLGSVAHHDVIDPPRRHEVKLGQQVRHLGRQRRQTILADVLLALTRNLCMYSLFDRVLTSSRPKFTTPMTFLNGTLLCSLSLWMWQLGKNSGGYDLTSLKGKATRSHILRTFFGIRASLSTQNLLNSNLSTSSLHSCL